MLSFIRFVYYVTSFLFLFGLLFSYYQFAPLVKISFSANTELFEYKSKEVIFYTFAGVFLVINMLFSLLRALVKNVNPNLLAIMNKNYWLQNEDTKASIHKVYLGWFTAINIFTNLLLTFIIAVLFFINVLENGTFVTFQGVFYGFIGAVSLSVFSLPLFFFLKEDTY